MNSTFYEIIKFKDVYDHSRRTRSAIRCFIKDLMSNV